MVLTAPKPWAGVVDPALMTADHVVPMRWGGRTEPDNIVAACYECNHARDRELKKGYELKAGADVSRSPFEILQGLKLAAEADEELARAEQARRKEIEALVRWGQWPTKSAPPSA
jgi:hypothetical protein